MSDELDSKPGFVPDLEEEVDRLYGLPLDEFTPARNDLAKRLRKDARRAEASRVGELAKPSLPAWTINRLARDEAGRIGELVEAGNALWQAQEEALATGQADAVREATRRQRELVLSLTGAARAALRAAGRPVSQQTFEKVASTLRAASVDRAAQPLLETGRLTSELEQARFELFPGVTAAKQPAARAPSPPKAASAAARPTNDTAALRREVRERQRRVRDLQATLRRLEREAKAAAQRAGEARKSAALANSEALQRTRAADEAKAALTGEQDRLAQVEGRLGR